MDTFATPGPVWFDAHTHPQLGEDGLLSIERARLAGVQKLVCVGTDSDSSQEAFDLAVSAGEGVFSTVGLHPHDAIKGLQDTRNSLNRNLANDSKKVVAIGECGLDYYYMHSPRDVQREVFAEQIELAKEHNLALVIHTRDAWAETFEILRSVGAPPRTVVHCFTGGPDEARIALDLGFVLSFSGIVTFKSATDIQAAAALCPVDRMTIETDSPYLAPVPLRGKPNESAHLPYVGRFISELKNMQVDTFAEGVFEVTDRLFGTE